MWRALWSWYGGWLGCGCELRLWGSRGRREEFGGDGDAFWTGLAGRWWLWKFVPFLMSG